MDVYQTEVAADALSVGGHFFHAAKIPTFSYPRVNASIAAATLGRRDHVVDQPVGLCLVGRHVVVALELALDALDRLTGVLAIQLDCIFGAQVHDLLRHDLDVRRRAPRARPTAGAS